MTILRSFPRDLTILIAAAVVTACSGASTTQGIPAAGQAQRLARPSWIDPAAKNGALLYVSDSGAKTVLVYTYPGLQPAGTLTGFSSPAGLCVDKSGNVWVTDTLKSDVVEFAHGGTTPIKTLTDGEGYVGACAVNPVNGDLAIVNNTVGGDDPGNVVIFPAGSGTPVTYSDRHVLVMDFAAYDPQGDLFVDAQWFGHHGRLRLDELPSGGKKLLNVHWQGPQIKRGSNVQYADGSLALGDGTTGTVYRTSGGSVTGKTTINGACYVEQFYIERKSLIVPTFCSDSSGEILIYDYPAGGNAVKTLTGFEFPFGVTVSR